jgi:putative transposase
VRKNYQNQEIDTSQLAVPDTVSVALNELARELREGLLALGGRRVPVERRRMRAVDGSGELPVASYELFFSTEVLGRMAPERMLAGLPARRYPVGLEPVDARTDEAATSTSRVERIE